MSRCSVCNHSRREDIEQSLSLGWSQRAVGERFGVSPSALSRHRHNHGSHDALKREYNRLRREHRDLEHASALATVFTHAGCRTTQEIGEMIGEMIGEITGALVGARNYSVASGFMRASCCPEQVIWSVLEESARGNGDDAGEVWEAIYAPQMEKSG